MEFVKPNTQIVIEPPKKREEISSPQRIRRRNYHIVIRILLFIIVVPFYALAGALAGAANSLFVVTYSIPIVLFLYIKGYILNMLFAVKVILITCVVVGAIGLICICYKHIFYDWGI